MQLEQILIIVLGVFALIDIWLIRKVKDLSKGFSLLVRECQNNTAMIFHFKNKLNISDKEYEQAIIDFQKMIDDFGDF